MTNTYDRRQFLTHSAAAAGGVVAAGALAGEMALSGEAGAVTKGGTLRVGVESDQALPFNPGHAHMDLSGFMMARAIYDPLMVVGSDGKTVYPYLAAGLTANKAFNQWTIKVRPNVKFHDGTPCNAAAIYANMVENYNSTLTGPAVKSLISGFTKTATTVTVHTRHKWTSFPFTLSEQQIAFIAAPSTIKATYKGNPVGTGPFIFQSYTPGSTPFIAIKNTKYWRTGLPYLQQVEYHVVPAGDTRLNGLKTNTLDIIVETEGDILKEFPGLGGGYTTTVDFPGKPVYSPGSNCIMLNCKAAPFTNKNLRLACAYAIDRQTFVTDLDSGESTAIDGIYLPGTTYYKKPAYPAYSKSQAQKYVAKVPANQRSFKLQYVAGDPYSSNAALLVQAMLAAVGITVTPMGVSQTVLIDNAVLSAYGPSYQAMTWSQFGGVSPDLNYPWFSTKTGLNFAQNLDPTTQNLMLAGMAATTQAARTKAWASVNDRLATEVPYLWSDRAVIGVAANADVKAWQSFTEPSSKAHKVLQPNQGVLFFTETWLS